MRHRRRKRRRRRECWGRGAAAEYEKTPHGKHRYRQNRAQKRRRMAKEYQRGVDRLLESKTGSRSIDKIENVCIRCEGCTGQAHLCGKTEKGADVQDHRQSGKTGTSLRENRKIRNEWGDNGDWATTWRADNRDAQLHAGIYKLQTPDTVERRHDT